MTRVKGMMMTRLKGTKKGTTKKTILATTRFPRFSASRFSRKTRTSCATPRVRSRALTTSTLTSTPVTRTVTPTKTKTNRKKPEPSRSTWRCARRRTSRRYRCWGFRSFFWKKRLERRTGEQYETDSPKTRMEARLRKILKIHSTKLPRLPKKQAPRTPYTPQEACVSKKTVASTAAKKRS